MGKGNLTPLPFQPPPVPSPPPIAYPCPSSPLFSPLSILPLNLRLTLSEAELRTGDILVFEEDDPPASPAAGAPAPAAPAPASPGGGGAGGDHMTFAAAGRPPRFASCVEFYDFLDARVTVRFRRLHRPAEEWSATVTPHPAPPRPVLPHRPS